MLLEFDLKWFVVENDRPPQEVLDLLPELASIFEKGWGNGYVCIPEGHPCFRMSCWDIDEKFEIYINGGLTWSKHSDYMKHWPEVPEGNWWIVGFDTAHAWDSLERWPKHAVEEEAQNLMRQLILLKPRHINLKQKIHISDN